MTVPNGTDILKSPRTGRVERNEFYERPDRRSLLLCPGNPSFPLSPDPGIPSGRLRLGEGVLDYFVVFLRKTIYRDRPLPYELTEGNEFTHAVGSFLDNMILWLNKTIWKNHPRKEKNYEHRLAMFYTMIHENNTIITRSLSFGLMMFCAGLFAVLLYLLTV